MGNIYLGEKELTQVQNINVLSGDVETLSGDVGTVSGNVKNHVEDETIHVTSDEKLNWNNKVDENDITNFFDGAEYEDSGTTKVINFYHGDTIKATINATDFIKDGMVSNVEVKDVAGSGTCLVITFNEDSGTGSTKHEDINIPLTDIFDPSNYYTTGQTSGATALTTAFAAKQDVLTEGRAIDITSNVISLDLPISAGTGTNALIYNSASNVASGECSHAEGNSTTASSSYSHAEGQYTKASGSISHAEGYSTTANGACSHAEGSVTKASGNNSHAEGYETSATSEVSHAEGRGTQANGTHSHAEGYYTVANNKSEHASGQYNVSSKTSTTFGNSGNTLFSVGNGTSTSARHNAFEVRQNGDIYITSASSDIRLQDCLNDTTYSAGTAAQLSAGTNTYNGVWSAKILRDGLDSLYEVSAGRAIDITNKAISLDLPISAGTGANSIIEGSGTKAGGSQSHAEGRDTTASGQSSHAEGYQTTASGDYSHAEGRSTIASGDYSHAEGRSTIASGRYSHAEGSGTTASGNYSHAEGYQTTASGNYSHAEGSHTQASGSSSHAEGSGTTASGDYSHAEGRNTMASGNFSHAEGRYTTASGDYSHAEGYQTTASGFSSHAEGSHTQASGSSSHAEGFYTVTNNQSEHASGQYNVSSSASTTFGDSGNTLFSVGNGTSESARHNAFEIRQNGLSYMNGNVHVSGTVSQVSDERLKNIIEDKELLLEEIVNAPLVSYTFKGVENDSPHIGTIAQYWLDILPEVVCEYDSDENNLSLDYSSLNVAIGISLAKIIKKQSIEIDSLKEEITQLKQNIGKIE